MDKVRRTTSLIGVAVIALALAACAKTASPASSGPSSTTSAGETIKTAMVAGVGTVVVDSSDRTLYMLTADSGGKVTCASSPCTGTWPPELLPAGGSVHAGNGIDASKLGTVKTPSGAMQVTYNHWPLYRYAGDTGPGQANGQGIQSFGGVWHPLDSAGQQVMSNKSSTSPSSTTGGYGY